MTRLADDFLNFGHTSNVRFGHQRAFRSAISFYDDGPQGGIVARSDVKSEVLTWPSTLPSSSMSTPDQGPDCTRILTLAFRGTRLSSLQLPPPPLSTGVVRIAKRRWSKIFWLRLLSTSPAPHAPMLDTFGFCKFVSTSRPVAHLPGGPNQRRSTWF